MTLATDHPQYDALGELLCILPHHPYRARIDEVTEDTGFASERSITALARRAQTAGHDVRISYTGGNSPRLITVLMPEGGASHKAALSYWDTVYRGAQG